MNNVDSGIAAKAFDAAGGDFLFALALVLDLIWSGRLVATRAGIVRAPRRMAA